MRILTAIFLSIAFLCGSIFAEESKSDLVDFVLPVPDNFVNSASGGLKNPDKKISDYLKAVGIVFPEGAKVELDHTKKTLIAKLPHRQALNLVQLINSFMSDSADESSKDLRDFFEGRAKDSCWD